MSSLARKMRVGAPLRGKRGGGRDQAGDGGLLHEASP
jgi:hypothetical protein